MTGISILLLAILSTFNSLHVPISDTKNKILRLKMTPIENTEWVQPITDASNYVFSAPEVTPEIYVGNIWVIGMIEIFN